MYSEITKSEAFLLFCQGFPYRRIAEIMRTHPGCEKITHSTIKGWAESADRNGLTWNDRKGKYLQAAENAEGKAVARQHQDVITRTDNIKNKILDDIEAEGKLDFKTKAEAIYAFLAIQRWQKDIKDEEKRVTIEDQVTLLFDAMHEIPEVSDALSKHWDDINRRFQGKAREMMKDKSRGR